MSTGDGDSFFPRCWPMLLTETARETEKDFTPHDSKQHITWMLCIPRDYLGEGSPALSECVRPWHQAVIKMSGTNKLKHGCVHKFKIKITILEFMLKCTFDHKQTRSSHLLDLNCGGVIFPLWERWERTSVMVPQGCFHSCSGNCKQPASSVLWSSLWEKFIIWYALFFSTFFISLSFLCSQLHHPNPVIVNEMVSVE